MSKRIITDPSSEAAPRLWPAYLLAAASTLLTLQVHLLMAPLLDGRPILVVFIVPVALSGYLGGLGPGLLATALSYALASYFLLPPLQSLLIATGVDRWQQVFVALVGLVVSGLSEALHRARRRASLTRAEHQQAREELKVANREAGSLRAALDEHAIVAITDPQGRITFVNDKFCAISKYSRDELLGQDHRIINSGSHSPAFMRELWATIGRGKVWQGEIKNRAKDGSFYWVATTIVPFLHEDGKPRQYVAIRADITERKLAEERLEISLKEARELKAALDEHAIVAVTDPQGKIVSVNDKFCEISRYSRAELIGQDHRIINSGNHPKEFIRDLWTTIAHGRVWHGEIKNKAKDGSFYWVDTTIVPFLNDQGKPRQYIAIRADITARKLAEAARRTTEARYQTLFEYAPDGIVIADRESTYIDANASICRMLGYTRTELIGLHASNIVVQTELAHIAPALTTIQSQADYHREWQFRRKDGSVFWGEVIATLMPDGNLMGIIRDITERKAADEKLKSSAKEVLDLKAALDEHAIVAITDPQGRITYVNDKFCAISKYRREELIGQDHRIINSGHHSAEFIRELWTTIAHGGVWHGEIKNKAKDGSFYWVDTTIVPFLNEQGKPRQYVAIRADITERKRAEEALRESEERLHIVIENLNEGLVIADGTGEVLHWNRAGLAMVGFENMEEGHRQLQEFGEIFELSTLDGTVLPVERWPLRRVLDGEQLQDCELRIRRIDSDWTRIFSYGGALVQDSTGKQLAFVALSDITERKHAEGAMRARDVAEAASRLKSEFLANMSHELRTPLNGIIGFSEFLVDEKPGPLNPKQKEYLGDVLNSGRHLLQLINDVLDLAKIEAGKMTLQPEPFSLAKAVHEVCAVVSPFAKKKPVHVQVEIASEIGEVVFDQAKFKQVLYNLLSNAVKFTAAGGEARIIAAIEPAGWLQLEVRDTGIGIRAEDLGKLFVEFQQLDSSYTRQHQGTGLGLALTKKIVELHGGRIRAGSEPGKGSIFTVELPLTPKPAAESARPEEPRR